MSNKKISSKTVLLLGLVVYPILFAATNYVDFKQEETIIEIEPKPIQPIPIVEIEPLDVLIDAMIIVESQGNDSAIGDTHLGSQYAVGALQIRPIMVREVNRILKLKGVKYRYKLKDRYDRDKSIEMFLIWKEFHHKDSDFEVIARSWNGGSNGPKKSKTYNYWKKVEQQLASL